MKKTKVVFLFMSQSSAPKDSCSNNWRSQPCGEFYQEKYGDECYFKMFQDLLDCGVINDLTVFFESNVQPGKANFVKGAKNYVVPEINLIEPFIDKDTIIFVRGGFRHWHDFLVKYHRRNWLILYAANTGRQRWTWWDIVLDDLNMSNSIDRYGRYFFPFIKPTNEDVFSHKKGYFNIKWDLCVGASHIHDKKGQYHAVNVLKEFYNLFAYLPPVIMPGAVRSSRYTKQMIQDAIMQKIACPGMVSKKELDRIFNQCKILLHFGAGGQNDRSILEGFATGLQIGVSTLKNHSPLMTPDEKNIFHFDLEDPPKYSLAAKKLKKVLDNWVPECKDQSSKKYQELMSYQKVVLPMLKQLFKIVSFHGHPSLRAKEHLQTQFKKGRWYGTGS